MKPRRHARSTKAQQRKLFPIPHGPVTIKLWRSASHAQVPSCQDLLAVEPSGRREVDGLERRRMTQLGRLQAPLQLALFAGRPLGVDSRPKRSSKPSVAASPLCSCCWTASAIAPSFMALSLSTVLFDQHRSSSSVVAAA